MCHCTTPHMSHKIITRTSCSLHLQQTLTSSLPFIFLQHFLFLPGSCLITPSSRHCKRCCLVLLTSNICTSCLRLPQIDIAKTTEKGHSLNSSVASKFGHSQMHVNHAILSYLLVWAHFLKSWKSIMRLIPDLSLSQDIQDIQIPITSVSTHKMSYSKVVVMRVWIHNSPMVSRIQLQQREYMSLILDQQFDR